MSERDARADGSKGRNSIRGAGVGHDAKVDIAERAELSLEHDVLARLDGSAEIFGSIADIVGERQTELLEPCAP